MYLVKNWDYRVGIMDHVMIIHITQPDGTRIMGLTEAGQVIRGGMNSHGLGSVSNNLQSIYDAWAVGLPTVFARRQLLKYKTFDEIKDFILYSPLQGCPAQIWITPASKSMISLETVQDLIPRGSVGSAG